MAYRHFFNLFRSKPAISFFTFIFLVAMFFFNAADVFGFEEESATPSLIQSNYGDQGNFEVVVNEGGELCHYWRDNKSLNQFAPWKPSVCFGEDIASAPAMIQSNYGDQDNFDVVVKVGDELCHYWRDNNTPGFPWMGPMCFGEGITSAPAMTLSDYGHHGNFEVVAQVGDQLCHYWRKNDDPNIPWTLSECFGENVTSAPAMIQSSFGDKGNFEVVVREGDILCHYWRDNDAPGTPWIRTECFSEVVSSAPALIQSRFGNKNNFEVLVREDNQLCHYFRDNDDPITPWIRGECFGDQVTSGAALIQGNYGHRGNFEVVVREAGHWGHYWRDNDNPDLPWYKSDPNILGFELVDVTGMPHVPEDDLGSLKTSSSNLIDLIDVPYFSIRAKTLPARVGSVKIEIFSGSMLVTSRKENAWPYAAAGDSPIGTYNDLALPPGDYTLRATPYTDKNLTGIAGEARDVSFTVQ